MFMELTYQSSCYNGAYAALEQQKREQSTHYLTISINKEVIVEKESRMTVKCDSHLSLRI